MSQSPAALPSPSPSVTFASLGLSPESLRALAQAGYVTPTPIQARAIPPALTGVDLIGCAATGTGKTAAFALPMVERLAGKKGTRALILAPTRELAVQIAEHVERFGGGRGVGSATLIGGVGIEAQKKALRHGAQIIIATPGRLIDHLEQGTAKLSEIEILVLDEADRMLDMGFKPQLTKILARVPKARQTLLFSATMAGEVADFARAHLKSPVKVEVNSSGTTAARADQRIFLVDQNHKTALLMALLDEDQASTLVFTRTKRRADKVAKSLEKVGHAVARIHADRSQGQRQAALEGFRNFKYRVLVATDIAARGIDVAEIGHVVNYDLPHVPEDYVHRVGRTARAAATGRASSFSAPDELPLLKDIERYVRTAIPRAPLPKDSKIFQDEVAASSARQAHPGPPQRHGGGRPQQQGQRRSGGGRQSPRRGGGGGRSQAASGSGESARPAGSKPVSLFRGSPKRR